MIEYDAAEITRRLRASQAKKEKEKREKEARASTSGRRPGPKPRRSARPGPKPPAKSGGVVRRGQRATLNGKPVIADGKGNWRRFNPLANSMSSGTVVGTYKPGVVRKPAGTKPKKADIKLKPGMNPRTGKPYSQSPGKASKPPATKPAPTQQKSASKPKPKPKPKAKSGMSDLDKRIAGAQTFIATYKDKGPGMQRAVKKMKERLARLRAKKNTGKSDLAKANRNVA